MFQKCLGIFGKSIREHLAIGPGTFGKSAREYLAIEASAPPPIAEEGSDCIEREGISLFTGMHTPQCRSCLNRVAELENAFRFRLENVKVCAKHPGRPAVARCTGCHLPHCEKCLYFTTTHAACGSVNETSLGVSFATQSGVKRTSGGCPGMSLIDPKRTFRECLNLRFFDVDDHNLVPRDGIEERTRSLACRPRREVSKKQFVEALATAAGSFRYRRRTR
jgi:hypothetical protein